MTFRIASDKIAINGRLKKIAWVANIGILKNAERVVTY